jgi:hypothetical protein
MLRRRLKEAMKFWQHYTLVTTFTHVHLWLSHDPGRKGRAEMPLIMLQRVKSVSKMFQQTHLPYFLVLNSILMLLKGPGSGELSQLPPTSCLPIYMALDTAEVMPYTWVGMKLVGAG